MSEQIISAELQPSHNSIETLTSGGNNNPLVSVVFLSYNRPTFLQEALASVVHQSYENLQITVVDNPSPSSGEVSRLVEGHPTVKLIQNSTNLGYTGGMNKGIQQATGDYVFLTEDDIVLERDCIQRLVEYLEKHPSADLASPIIYNKTSNTIRCAGGDFALGGVYRKQVFGAGEIDVGQFPHPFVVNYIDGATMFARREFWQHFKGFREEYFMYVDAVELCARVRKLGKQMVIVPEAKVYHFEAQEKLTPPEIEFHKVKNFFSLYLLHAPMRSLPEFFFRYAVINTARTLLSRKGSTPRTFLKALLCVVKSTPSLLRERRAKPSRSAPFST
jgi:GT2 family glycosyltransferase